MDSYADQLRMEHALTVPTVTEQVRVKAVAVRAEGQVEPKLVATVMSMGHHDRFHPTKAIAGEELPIGFAMSCIGFLLNTTVTKVSVN